MYQPTEKQIKTMDAKRWAFGDAILLWRAVGGYNEVTKDALKSAGMAYLKALRTCLGWNGADVRYNRGGIAVAGDFYLHSDHWYVNPAIDTSTGSNVEVMFRTCKGKKDYTGGTNQWCSLDNLYETLRRVEERRLEREAANVGH